VSTGAMLAFQSSIQDVSVDWPTWRELFETLTFRAGHNTAVVMTGTAMLGAAGGVVGTFALLRQRAMMGDALSHATLPGIVIAFLVATALGLDGKSVPVLLAGAATTGVLGVLTVHAILRFSRLTEDAAIGIVLACFFGAGVVLLTYAQNLPSTGQGGLDRFILGQTAAIRTNDAVLVATVAGVSAIVALLMFKEFRAVCFDDRFAAASGMPVAAIDLVMMALVVAVLVSGLQAVGLVLVVALLIIPPAAARFWTERLGVMTLLAAFLGALSGYLGSAASALLPRLPAGAVIVITAGVIFTFGLVAAPKRGIVAAIIQRVGLRLKMARDHMLRICFEQLEADSTPVTAGAIVSSSALHAARAWSSTDFAMAKMNLRIAGLMEKNGADVRLTERGAAEATRITRSHRLLEEYLVTHADIAASHVHTIADLAEHSLSPEMVAELEESLRLKGIEIDSPPSVHNLRGGPDT